MSGSKRDFRAAPAGWAKAPRIDGDAVFRTIIACYPTKSYWNLDVDLQAAIRNTGAVNISGTTIGRSMVGIVARMPIYSRNEIDRERERESAGQPKSGRAPAGYRRLNGTTCADPCERRHRERS